MDELEFKQLVEKLRAIGQDTQDIEVKASAKKLPNSIVDTLSAFSNGSGGVIILGLEEKNGFKPSPGFAADSIADALANAALSKLTPPIRPHIEMVSFEGATIVCAQVPALAPQDKPAFVSTRGMYQGSYLRTHDGDHKLSQYEVDRLLENKRQPQHDIEMVPGATVDDFDPDLLAAFLQRQRALSPRIFSKVSDTQARLRLKVTVDDNGIERPTLAGLMALGSFPQEYFPQLMITFALYSGSEKASSHRGTRFLDSGSFNGPIPAMVADGLEAVARNMRTRSTIEGAFRKDLPDYSLLAIREALTNALMHRDYSPAARGTQVQLNMYADRLEIQNPGGLYGAVTIDTLGTEGVSSSRNSYLSKILEATPYEDGGYVAENRGSGYSEILAQQHRNFLQPPIPKDSLTSFSITFPRRTSTEAEINASEGRSSRDAILEFLHTHNTASAHELSATAGIALGSTRRVLRQLIDEGRVQRTEPTRSPKQRYKLIH